MSPSTAPHLLQSRSGSIPHDPVTADPRPPRHSLFLPARPRQWRSSHRTTRFAASPVANLVTHHPVHAYTADRSPNISGKPIAATGCVNHPQASRRSEIPIDSAARPPPPNDFVPWRFSAAGRPSPWLASSLPAAENLHKAQNRTSSKFYRDPDSSSNLAST